QPMSAALELLAALEKELSIDPHRRLVAGMSMGGFGAWDAILRYPDRFAGAMPVCGGGDPTQAAAARSVPVWAFHGAKDDVVPVSASRLMVKALKKAGGRVRYTEYAGVGHNAWDRAFADRRAVTWLLDQRQSERPTTGGSP
ncbi:MAG TPA: alpha/beta hydrolase-fold protein, partial [Polyangia bacterium]|nr:alpha/beta hydrolase-fold protein [Polyangia bacterium]